MNESQVMHAMSIDDAYRVEQVLARSACGVTELVTIDGTGPFVRKKIDRDQARRSVWAIVADCRCRFLPQVRATYEMPEWFVVVYDFVPGETLEHRVARTGALPADEAVRMVQNVCVAVGELHAHGVIHRDLSPANIVLSSDGAHVIDLGIARTLADRSPGVSTPYGTMGFASPEQYGFDGIKTDVRSDVYSIGRLLDFALTGVRSEDTRHAALLHDARVVPLHLREIIERACAFEPSARYQTVAQLGAAVDAEVADVKPPQGDAMQQDVKVGVMPPVQSSQSGAASATVSPAYSNQNKGFSRFARIMLVVCATAVTLVTAFGALVHLAGGSLSSFTLLGLISAVSEEGRDGASSAADPNNAIVSSASSAKSHEASQAAKAEAPVDEAFAALEVAESGWFVKESGYIYYAFALHNSSTEYYVDLPGVIITGRAEDGSIVFTETQVLSGVAPGETIYYGFSAGNGTPPASVEFAVDRPQEWAVDRFSGDAPVFSTTSVNAVPDGIGGVDFTGEVRSESGDDDASRTMAAVSVILRNESGAMLAGATTFVSKPVEGEAVPFSVNMYDPPEYATVEAHVQHW